LFLKKFQQGKIFFGKMDLENRNNENRPELFVVATPIGNLSDVTQRALEVLRLADIILCEDTRVTQKLLAKYQIQKPLISYHQRSRLQRVEKILEHLGQGKKIALVTDAGTPGISDPGNELIEKILENFKNQVKITPIPGPSALTALLQVAGINVSKFVFLGFPPNKKGRETFFKKAVAFDFPVVYYESPYRFLKNLELLKNLCQRKQIKLGLVVGRELTKVFEEVRRGSLDQVLSHYQNNPDKIKGEFVIIIYKIKK